MVGEFESKTQDVYFLSLEIFKSLSIRNPISKDYLAHNIYSYAHVIPFVKLLSYLLLSIHLLTLYLINIFNYL